MTVAGGRASELEWITMLKRMPSTSCVRSAAAATGFGLNGLALPSWRSELATTRISSRERTPAAWRRRRESGSRSGPPGVCRFCSVWPNIGDTSAVFGGVATDPLWVPQMACAPGGGVEVGGSPDKT